MPETKLTKAQTDQLRDAFLDLSSNLGQYRMSHSNDISEADVKKLKNFEHQFSNISQNFNMQSASLLLSSADVSDAMASITETTKDLNAAVKKIKGIKKIIGVVTAAFDLASAIGTRDFGAITKAIGGVATAISKKDDVEKDAEKDN